MAPRWCVYIAHRWRFPRVFYCLVAIEIPLTIAALALFGIADPDTYRTKLWQDGSDNHFNSNPNEVLYAYANYEPIHTPLIWSQFMTQFNVVISVLSMFIMLVKATMYVLHAWLPILSVLVHALLIALYAVGVRNQATPDLSNTNVKNLSRNLPWYLEKGCSYAAQGNHGYCMQARASFAVTCVMLALFVTYFAWSLYNAFIRQDEKAERLEDYNEVIELKNARYTMDGGGLTKEEKWERNRQIFLNLPKTPSTPAYGMRNPMTPRTTAFTQLSGGDASGVGGPSRPLAFRQQYGEVPVPDAR